MIINHNGRGIERLGRVNGPINVLREHRGLKSNGKITTGSYWGIASVDLKMQDQWVGVIEYADEQGLCPECGTICPKHDSRKKRTWRQLDAMPFSTDINNSSHSVILHNHEYKD